MSFEKIIWYERWVIPLGDLNYPVVKLDNVL